MDTSKTIAGLIGPTLVAIAAAMLMNLAALPAFIELASRNPALVFESGILVFVAGVAIVRVHNRWTFGWPVVVTMLGWLAILGGLTRMLFTVQLLALAARLSWSAMAAEALALLVLGGFLTFKAYSRA